MERITSDVELLSLSVLLAVIGLLPRIQ
jgi:hypothetical protein